MSLKKRSGKLFSTPVYPRMKTVIALLLTVLWMVSGSVSHAQTLNWGSAVFTDLIDSDGNTLPEGVYTFELGVFANDFVPEESNASQWLGNWRVFDTAGYNGYSGPGDPIYGYFTGTEQIGDGVTNQSSSFSFAGMSAYLWIRKGDEATEGSEWFLARASNWTFPGTGGGCCANDTPIEWSVSDLVTNGETPLWGNHGGIEGPGEHTFTGTYGGTGPYVVQTYTFVPEPSSLLLAAFSAGLMLRRRRI